MRRWRAFLAAWGLAVLAACGGGSDTTTAATVASNTQSSNVSGSQNTPEASAPNRTPVANAGSAQSVDLGSAVTLSGVASSDPDGDRLTYTWALSSSPPGSRAALTNPTSAQLSFTPDVAGTYTVTLSVSDGRGGGDTSSVQVIATNTKPAAIAIDQSEPLSGTAKLSLSGTVPGGVTWYIDLRLLGSGNAADGHSISWNTTGVANGDHQVLAVIQGSSGAPQSLSRTVRVSNSTVTLSASASGTTGTINVDVRANSTFGITGVTATFDGAPFGSLSQPNACSRYCSGSNDIYRFAVNAAAAGSGAHTMEIIATDKAGSSKSVTVSVPVNNAPVISLTEPTDGALAFGMLRVAGRATTDKTGAVTTTARLGDVEFLNTQSSSFSGVFNLTGVTAGTYILMVRSTDSAGQATQVQRSVVVTSSAGLAYTPVFSMPSGGQLLAAEGGKVLYSSGDGGDKFSTLQPFIDEGSIYRMAGMAEQGELAIRQVPV